MNDDRVIWGTRKCRALDLKPGDVIRNRYGKWDVIVEDGVKVGPTPLYIEVTTETQVVTTFRTVHLVDVQVAKPS